MVGGAVGPANKPPATGIYTSPSEALKKVCAEYEYWSGKLTETSLQMCYALIAGNWVIFGSVNGILKNEWAKWSLLLVILALASNAAGAFFLSELLKRRVAYGQTDSGRWELEYDASSNVSCSWPFTSTIDGIGRWMRIIKFGFTLAAGGCLFIGAILK